MLWTWVFLCLLIGELVLYFILATSKYVFPYEVTDPFKAKVFFYVLCLALFIMGGISFFSYQDTQQRLRDLDSICNRLMVLPGRDLEDHSIAEYRRIMDGLWALGGVRVYMSFTLMIAALIQMVLAAILGRSRTSIQSSEPISGERFFP